MPTLLVTGASGFIGKEVVRELLSSGFKIKALIRDLKRAPEGVEIVLGDMTDIPSLREATKGIDGIIHLAALKLDEKESFNVNVLGAKNLVATSLENKVKFIINVSTSSTKIKSKGKYGLTKKAADKIIIGSGIPSITLKPSIVYGDLENGVFSSLASFARLPIIPVIGNGKCKFYPIHINDLSKIISILAKKNINGSKVYDVGGPDTLSMNEILSKISREVFKKKRVFILHISKRLGMALAEMFSFVTSHPPITISNILGSTQDIPWNKEGIFRVCNFTPQSFDKGVRDVKKEFSKKEAEIIYKYIYSSSGEEFSVSPELEERYFTALKNNDIKKEMSTFLLRFPFLIGPVDAISKLFYSKSILQRRLLVATAIIECDTQSAKWLLPKDRGPLKVILEILKISISAFLKMLVGIILLLIPNFIKNHAG